MSRPHAGTEHSLLNFERTLEEALVEVKRTLDDSRNPKLPWGDDAVPHTYDDKYEIAQLVGKAALAANLSTLSDGLGLTSDIMALLVKSRDGKKVTLRFSLETSCAYVKTTKKERDVGTKVEKSSSLWGKTTYKNVQVLYEHLWDYKVKWKISVYIGTDEANAINTLSREGTRVIKTVTSQPDEKSSPFFKSTPVITIDTDITWMLNSAVDGNVHFTIDRTDSEKCKTPRRNQQVDELFAAQEAFVAEWCGPVKKEIERACRDACSNYPDPSGNIENIGAVHGKNLFCSVAAMVCMELHIEEGDEEKGSAAFASDFDALLSHQTKHLRNRFESMKSVLKDGSKPQGVLSTTEAKVVISLDYFAVIGGAMTQAFTAIEGMLRKQVVAAIGKEIGPKDFSKYMQWHNQRLFKDAYAPRGFSYAIRRPEHYPEGTLSIENADGEPISTTVHRNPKGHSMKFPLSAAVNVSFQGDHYVHAHVFHKFSSSSSSISNSGLTMIARARQFSSFILLVGSLGAADTFLPESAMIIQNKDEIKIPLMLETIPTPKEFRDAIESLSPEQQAFCKAYRKLQLAGTLFAVCVVQIKPQLEALLNLPPDGLTKEVQMCQDLMSMFIEYQIPSDLLAYDGDKDAAGDEIITAVKGHMAAIKDMIKAAKDEELRQEKERVEKQYAKELALKRDREERRALENSGMMEGGRGSAPKSMHARKRMAPQMARAMAMPPPAVPKSIHFSGARKEVDVATECDDGFSAEEAEAAVDDKADSAGEDASDVSKNIESSESSVSDEVRDYTKIPREIDNALSTYDTYNSLRATKIKLSEVWEKTSQNGLLSKSKRTKLRKNEQKSEKNKAFDLIDALSRSGSLALQQTSLHVVLAATHCFDVDLINTVVQDNVNPIARVETSELILASTIHGKPAKELIHDFQARRIEIEQVSNAQLLR